MPFSFWRSSSSSARIYSDGAEARDGALRAAGSKEQDSPGLLQGLGLLPLPRRRRGARLSAGDPLTPNNAEQNAVVVRGPHWKYRDEDGGPGRPGIVLVLEPTSNQATVFWYQTGTVGTGYRVDFGKQDLALISHSGAGIVTAPDSEPASPTSPSSARSVTTQLAWPIANEEEPARGPLGRFADLLRRPFARSGPAYSPSQGPASADRWERKNSQRLFAESTQTAIIFDWDDTLFPTTYAFYSDRGLQLDMMPISKQKHLNKQQRGDARQLFSKAATKAAQLLHLAAKHGRVIILTLASRDWVKKSVEYFYMAVGYAIEELHVPIVYAKEFTEDCDAKAPEGSSRKAHIYWSAVKGRAIAKELNKFYSQYDGQSWKNVVSIGDSQFERLGTLIATAEYRKDRGRFQDDSVPEEAETVRGQLLCVRTKTFKMIEEPSVQEIMKQHDFIMECLPLMVVADSSMDLCVSDVHDPANFDRILERLRCGTERVSRKKSREKRSSAASRTSITTVS